LALRLIFRALHQNPKGGRENVAGHRSQIFRDFSGLAPGAISA